jgi:hypothetical protein
VAGGDEFLGAIDGVKGAAAALLFIGSGTNVYDAFSAVMSSPWSTEKFSEDEAADRMANEYVCHGLIISGFYAVAGAVIARTFWPVIGAAGVALYMTWLYRRAISRAKAKRVGAFSSGWEMG